mmetsp:Transcript_29527/g.55241  ORF Transcript_29527/g.55241 Transcript_29527/m.55241 type:complete len:121 (+) Transcript_29527:556-918(+)
MIFLSKDAKNQKKNGQKLLGVLDVVVDRNHFGRQKFSFEGEISSTIDNKKHNGVFIRAPGILEVGKRTKVLGTIEHDKCKTFPVAVQQGSLLATSFHPELTDDTAWHLHFLEMVKKSRRK